MRGHSYNPEGCSKCGKIHKPPFKGWGDRVHPMTGKHHSESTKDKLRIAHTGKQHSELTIEKMRAAHKCPETVEKKRAIAIELWKDIEFRESHTGENNHAYIDGLRNNYPSEFNESLRESIRERDRRICQMPGCGKTEQENGRKLDVHHIDYNTDNCENYNLISLCLNCHAKTNIKDRECWQAIFEEINCAWMST